MPDQTVNVPLLRKAVEWAEAEAAKPRELSEWRQQYWVTPATEADREGWGIWAHPKVASQQERSAECGTCYCVAGYVVASQIGPVTHKLDERARELLGLAQGEADALFAATNTIADVRRIAEEIAGERL